LKQNKLSLFASGAVRTCAILMQDQHLYQSPTIEVYGHCRLLLPRLSVPIVEFFCYLGLKNCWHGLGFELNSLDLFSQSGIFDHSAMATPDQLTSDTKCMFDSRIFYPNLHLHCHLDMVSLYNHPDVFQAQKHIV